MRVDGVAFDRPAGLEDSTSYSYHAPSSYEELNLEFELPIGRATPADEVIAEVREGLAGYFGAELSIVAQGDQVFVGQPGKFLQAPAPRMSTARRTNESSVDKRGAPPRCGRVGSEKECSIRAAGRRRGRRIDRREPAGRVRSS
jgi:hypothetical protein